MSKDLPDLCEGIKKLVLRIEQRDLPDSFTDEEVEIINELLAFGDNLDDEKIERIFELNDDLRGAFLAMAEVRHRNNRKNLLEKVN